MTDNTDKEDWQARAIAAERRLKELEAWLHVPESAVKLESERLWQEAQRIAVASHNGDRRHGHIMEDAHYAHVPDMQRRVFLKLAIERILHGGLPNTTLL